MSGIYLSGSEFTTFAEAQRRLGHGGKGSLSAHVATRARRTDFMAMGMFLPNPDPILKRMGKDIEVYRALRSDAHTGGCIRRRKAAVKALEWRVERGKASARTTRMVQDLLDRLDLDSLINEIMDAVLYGYKPLELIWKERPGSAPELLDIIGKPPEWFLFDTDAEMRFKSREHPLHGEPLAPRKFLLAQQEASYANPYGFADLSMCFWPVTFKKGGLRYWVKFAEKYGMPWAIGKQPPNAPKHETEQLLDQLEAMIEDAVGVIPNNASVEMLQASGSSGNADAYERLLMFCRSEVAIALLGQNQSTEADSTHASAMAGLGVTYELRDGDKGLVESVLNKQLIRWIVDMHDGETAPAPVFELYEEDQVSKAQAERDEILSRTGVRFSKDYFLRTYGLHEGDIADTVHQPAAAFAEAPPAQPAPPRDALDELIDAELSQWREVMEPMTTPLRELLERAAAQGWTAHQLLQALPQVLPQMDADTLNARLDALTMAGRVSGLATDPHGERT